MAVDLQFIIVCWRCSRCRCVCHCVSAICIRLMFVCTMHIAHCTFISFVAYHLGSRPVRPAINNSIYAIRKYEESHPCSEQWNAFRFSTDRLSRVESSHESVKCQPMGWLCLFCIHNFLLFSHSERSRANDMHVNRRWQRHFPDAFLFLLARTIRLFHATC